MPSVLVDTSGGGQSTDFEVSLNSDGSGGSNSVSGTVMMLFTFIQQVLIQMLQK